MEIGDLKIEIRKWGRSQDPGGLIRSFVFFILFFLVVYLWIDPKLIYHGHGQSIMYPICTSEMNIFADFPAFPGKAVEYLAARLSHYYYYSWAGALIITAIAWLLCLGATPGRPLPAPKAKPVPGPDEPWLERE